MKKRIGILLLMAFVFIVGAVLGRFVHPIFSPAFLVFAVGTGLVFNIVINKKEVQERTNYNGNYFTFGMMIGGGIGELLGAYFGRFMGSGLMLGILLGGLAGLGIHAFVVGKK